MGSLISLGNKARATVTSFGLSNPGDYFEIKIRPFANNLDDRWLLASNTADTRWYIDLRPNLTYFRNSSGGRSITHNLNLQPYQDITYRLVRAATDVFEVYINGQFAGSSVWTGGVFGNLNQLLNLTTSTTLGFSGLFYYAEYGNASGPTNRFEAIEPTPPQTYPSIRCSITGTFSTITHLQVRDEIPELPGNYAVQFGTPVNFGISTSPTGTGGSLGSSQYSLGGIFKVRAKFRVGPVSNLEQYIVTIGADEWSYHHGITIDANRRIKVGFGRHGGSWNPITVVNSVNPGDILDVEYGIETLGIAYAIINNEYFVRSISTSSEVKLGVIGQYFNFNPSLRFFGEVYEVKAYSNNNPVPVLDLDFTASAGSTTTVINNGSDQSKTWHVVNPPVDGSHWNLYDNYTFEPKDPNYLGHALRTLSSSESLEANLSPIPLAGSINTFEMVYVLRNITFDSSSNLLTLLSNGSLQCRFKARSDGSFEFNIGGIWVNSGAGSAMVASLLRLVKITFTIDDISKTISFQAEDIITGNVIAQILPTNYTGTLAATVNQIRINPSSAYFLDLYSLKCASYFNFDLSQIEEPTPRIACGIDPVNNFILNNSLNWPKLGRWIYIENGNQFKSLPSLKLENNTPVNRDLISDYFDSSSTVTHVDNLPPTTTLNNNRYLEGQFSSGVYDLRVHTEKNNYPDRHRVLTKVGNVYFKVPDKNTGIEISGISGTLLSVSIRLAEDTPPYVLGRFLFDARRSPGSIESSPSPSDYHYLSQNGQNSIEIAGVTGTTINGSPRSALELLTQGLAGDILKFDVNTALSNGTIILFSRFNLVNGFEGLAVSEVVVTDSIGSHTIKLNQSSEVLISDTGSLQARIYSAGLRTYNTEWSYFSSEPPVTPDIRYVSYTWSLGFEKTLTPNKEVSLLVNTETSANFLSSHSKLSTNSYDSLLNNLNCSYFVEKVSSSRVDNDFTYDFGTTQEKIVESVYNCYFLLLNTTSMQKYAGTEVKKNLATLTHLLSAKVSSNNIRYEFNNYNELEATKISASSLNNFLNLDYYTFYVKEDNPGNSSIALTFKIGQSLSFRKKVSNRQDYSLYSYLTSSSTKYVETYGSISMAASASTELKNKKVVKLTKPHFLNINKSTVYKKYSSTFVSLLLKSESGFLPYKKGLLNTNLTFTSIVFSHTWINEANRQPVVVYSLNENQVTEFNFFINDYFLVENNIQSVFYLNTDSNLTIEGS